jgi:hypothetical protein
MAAVRVRRRTTSIGSAGFVLKTWTLGAWRQFIAAIGGVHELLVTVFDTPVHRERRGREAAVSCDL